MNHVKPTQQELEENIKNIQAELDKPDEVKQDAVVEEPKEEVKETNIVEKTEETDIQPEKKVDQTQEEIDYKKKFTESTREAKILHAKTKKINDVIEQANSLPDPTDEELVKEFSDWDVMSETEKKLAKDNLLNRKRFQMLEEITKESKDFEAWNNKVDTFVSDPQTLLKNPKLEGKEEEFKVFATKQTRRGVDFEVLVSSFLYEVDQKKPVNKGKMFETGTAGPNDRPNKNADKLSLTEAQNLMKTDYQKYKELLLKGKIDMTNV